MFDDVGNIITMQLIGGNVTDVMLTVTLLASP